MGENRDDRLPALRADLARELKEADAAIQRSRTALGVNGSLVSALGWLTLRNLPLVLDALARISALEAELETLKAAEAAFSGLA